MTSDQVPPPDVPPAGAPPPAAAHARGTALLEVVLCSGLPTQFALAALAAGLGLAPVDADGGLSLPFVLTVSLADTAVLVGLMVALTRARGESPRELWLGTRPLARETALGVLLVPVVFALVAGTLIGLRAAAPWMQNLETNPLETLAGTASETAALGIVGVLAGGVREELQRAFLLRRFERHLGGPAVGVVVLTIGFGLGHLLQGRDAAVATGVVGAFWALLYLRRRSVVAPLVSHAGFNALEVLSLAAAGL